MGKTIRKNEKVLKIILERIDLVKMAENRSPTKSELGRRRKRNQKYYNNEFESSETTFPKGYDNSRTRNDSNLGLYPKKLKRLKTSKTSKPSPTNVIQNLDTNFRKYLFATAAGVIKFKVIHSGYSYSAGLHRIYNSSEYYQCDKKNCTTKLVLRQGGVSLTELNLESHSHPPRSQGSVDCDSDEKRLRTTHNLKTEDFLKHSESIWTIRRMVDCLDLWDTDFPVGDRNTMRRLMVQITRRTFWRTLLTKQSQANDNMDEIPSYETALICKHASNIVHFLLNYEGMFTELVEHLQISQNLDPWIVNDIWHVGNRHLRRGASSHFNFVFNMFHISEETIQRARTPGQATNYMVLEYFIHWLTHSDVSGSGKHVQIFLSRATFAPKEKNNTRKSTGHNDYFFSYSHLKNMKFNKEIYLFPVCVGVVEKKDECGHVMLVVCDRNTGLVSLFDPDNDISQSLDCLQPLESSLNSAALKHLPQPYSGKEWQIGPDNGLIQLDFRKPKNGCLIAVMCFLKKVYENGNFNFLPLQMTDEDDLGAREMLATVLENLPIDPSGIAPIITKDYFKD